MRRVSKADYSKTLPSMFFNQQIVLAIEKKTIKPELVILLVQLNRSLLDVVSTRYKMKTVHFKRKCMYRR